MLPWLLGLIFGVVILGNLTSRITSEDKAEEFALGKETSTYWATDGEIPIHCSTPNDGSPCIDAYLGSSLQDEIVLWLGNSQLHAINQIQSQDINAVEILHQSLKNSHQYVMAFSYPNASLQQNYVTFEYLIDKLPVTTLVLPIVFDDLRETGVGSGFSAAFEAPEVTQRLERTLIGKSLVANFGVLDPASNDMLALQETVQEQSEKYLDTNLKVKWDVWVKRPELRAQIFGALYGMRNKVFGINASTVRKIIPGRYLLNFEALIAILESSKINNIDVVLYIVPLRNDVKRPYVETDYANFKEDVRSIALDHNVVFADLDDLVPSEEWGTKASTNGRDDSELDFMHFQAAGHERLARAIEAALGIVEEVKVNGL
ncbi:hypothetical protein N9I66_06035 [Pseudomonadales bacterium]|nr:hypothetical protein [Pseudomonadales bacterium]